MAKLRVVNTRFWDDDYTANLDPIEKLVFLYFLTNTSTDICGVYEIPLKKVAMDTGIDKDMVQKILDRFERDEKIIYENGWVGIRNFIKNQSLNPKVVQGIKNGLAKAPKEIITRLDIDVDRLSHSNLNSNTNSNLNPKEIASVIEAFKEVNLAYKKWFGNKTQRDASERLIETHGLENVLSVISILPKSNEMDFIPSVNTPLQLEDKWSALRNALKRHQNKINDVTLKNKDNVAFV